MLSDHVSGTRDAFTRREVAARARVHPRTIMRAEKRGELRVIRIGKSVRITRAELERFLGVQPGTLAP